LLSTNQLAGFPAPISFSITYFCHAFQLFDRIFDGLQILSNTTKHDQTRPKNTKQKRQCAVFLCSLLAGKRSFDVFVVLALEYHTLTLIFRYIKVEIAIRPKINLLNKIFSS